MGDHVVSIPGHWGMAYAAPIRKTGLPAFEISLHHLTVTKPISR